MFSKTLHDPPLAERAPGHLLRRAAAAHGERAFVTCGGVSVSYGEANRRANRVAQAFQRIGVGKGTRVGILCTNRLEYLDLWFGLAKLGAIELPINTEYKAAQLLHTLTRADVPVVVVEAALAVEFEALGDRLSCRHVIWLDAPVRAPNGAHSAALTELLAQSSDEEPAGVVSGADIGAIMNTSGTTGPSKGVLLPHGQQYWLGRSMALALELGPDDVFYNFFPLFHNTAQAMITIPVLLTGGQMILKKKFSVSEFWPDVRANNATVFYYIGEILHLLVKSGNGGEASGTRLRAGWGIGGAPADVEAFQNRYGVRLGMGYGSTEANVPVFRLLGADPKSAAAGKVLPEFDVRIAGPAGDSVPLGETGEILVRAREPSTLMAGYDGDERATREAFYGEWLRSGDAGRMDEQGNVYFVARIKDVIRVRGENVSAFEIEQTLAGFPGVFESAAIAVPAAIGGDDVKAVIVPHPGSQLDAMSIWSHCRQHLPKHSVPRYIEFCDALPKTETNKIRKNVLRERGLNEQTWDCVQNAYYSSTSLKGTGS